MEKKLQEFINEYRKKVSKLEREKHKAYFDAAVTGRKEFYDRYARLEIKQARFLSDSGSYRFLEELQAGDAIEDPLLKRQAKVLFLIYKAHQVPDDIQEEIIQLETLVAHKFSLFRAEVGGRRLTDNKVEEILETSQSSAEVEAAWKASKMVGGLVEKDVRKLVALRNRAANMLGYPNHHFMTLQLSEQDPETVNALFDQLDELTEKVFRSAKDRLDRFLTKKFDIAISELRPWHYQDRFFQEAPKITKLDLDRWYAGQDLAHLTEKFFASVGMPVDDLIRNSDLYEKPGKNQHAFCIHIDRYGDVRVLCNIRSNRRWMNTMLHEFGHAAYEKYYDEGLPFVLREPAHIFTTEAVAMFFGRMASDPLWMKAMGIIDDEEAGKSVAVSRDIMQMEQLVFSRWAQVMYRFERSMYANPEQDLNRLWWSLAERYQGLTPPDDISYPHWASKIHLATAPCYYHNYLLGELLASQIYTHIEGILPACSTGCDYVDNPDIGSYFKEKVFAPGARFHWSEMIRRATGSKLDPKFYARQFTSP